MTDRELLEAAAKAAGMTIGAWSDNYGAFMYRGVEPGKSWWNPLTDDGDALRLAVKAGLRDYFGIEIQDKCVQCTAFEPWEHCEYEDFKNGDPYAATRRAIVRAVAEIGRNMK